MQQVQLHKITPNRLHDTITIMRNKKMALQFTLLLNSQKNYLICINKN